MSKPLLLNADPVPLDGSGEELVDPSLAPSTGDAPPADTRPAAATDGAAADAPQWASVLIVDDNHNVARALGTLMTEAGYQPVVFTTGGDALAYAEGDHPAPAAAVVDVHLPDLNGLVLSQKLRTRLGPDAPIIVLSGDTSTETLKSLSHVGATYFFSKPVNGRHLVKQIKTLLGQAGK